MRRKGRLAVFGASFLVIAVAVLGYDAFGAWTASIFAMGYIGGLALWIAAPDGVPITAIKASFALTFGLFVLHLVEENTQGFHEALSEITGVASPGFTRAVAIVMACSVGAWVVAPLLLMRLSDRLFLHLDVLRRPGYQRVGAFSIPFRCVGHLPWGTDHGTLPRSFSMVGYAAPMGSIPSPFHNVEEAPF